MNLLARIVLVLATASWLLVPDRGVHFGASVAIHLVATAAWIVLVVRAVRGAYRPSFGEALGLALLLRALALPLAPGFSDDIYRYMFEGDLVLAGINPYVTAPREVIVGAVASASGLAVAPVVGLAAPAGWLAGALDALAQSPWALINNMEIPAAYPPAVQLALASGAALGGGSLGIKLVFAAFDLCTFVLLWRWLPTLGLAPQRAIVHGLCPLMVIEFAGEGHSDSLAVCAIVAALFAASRARPLAAGLLLGLAAAGKLMPVVLLPFVCRGRAHRWLTTAAFAVAVAALYAPFWVAADPLGIFRGTVEYAVRWRSNDTLFALIHEVTVWAQDLGLGAGFEVQRLAKIPLALIAALWLAWLWKRDLPPERAALWFFLFFIAAAPTVHPWYLAFLVPFLAFDPRLGWLAFTGTAILAYHVLPGWLTERRWEENPWVKVLEYAPFYLGFLQRRA